MTEQQLILAQTGTDILIMVGGILAIAILVPIAFAVIRILKDL